ncbi:mitochondrial ATP synthase g subunit-domain-containing protein [Amanita rubescens]|nr:mitochondrial ATP synthase g subunit-domain-containing protein [Amanita rubescens]KAF8336109.1 mitochondrial ATP synthase g subunit-domain-containing protein [Amanita rubescens]KAF8343202.1 mitochondrial ATP synthase g subunit-domain-containing protein [Amanita rubescens]
MRPALPSFTLRRSVQRIFTRNASSGTDGAQKKAQDVLSGAQKQAGQIWETSKKMLEPAGQRLGGMLGSYQQPLFYNLAVARELVKHIYRAERLSPPSLGAIQSAYSILFSQALSPAFWREAVVSGEILRIGVYGLEAYGIFKIGEIMGRRSLIGYNIQ